MADNVDVTPGTGKTIAADDVGGVLHQRVKITTGPDGQAGDVWGGNPLATLAFPAQSGGLSTYTSMWPNNSTGVAVKTSSGQLYGYFLYNRGADERTVKLYNKASAPTVGSDTPIMNFPLPPSGGANVVLPIGINFPLGIGIGVTTSPVYTDTGAPASGDVSVNLWYY